MVKQLIFISVIVVLWLGGASLAFQLRSTGCPKHVTAQADIDFVKYSGRWYTIMMYVREMGRLPKCHYIDIRYKQNKVHKSEVNETTETLSEKTHVVRKWKPAEGKMQDLIDIYILSTDYDTYSIHYSCMEADGIVGMMSLNILARDRLPPPDVVPNAFKIIEEQGLNIDGLKKVPQEACPN